MDRTHLFEFPMPLARSREMFYFGKEQFCNLGLGILIWTSANDLAGLEHG